jgi:23S rRNA pseudouridine1911/1915/1917 synthase
MEIVEKTEKTITFNLEILTGRTHQIRYHLSHHGLPIVGDYLYGDAKETEPMQLTAYKLIFRDTDNEIITVEI